MKRGRVEPPCCDASEGWWRLRMPMWEEASWLVQTSRIYYSLRAPTADSHTRFGQSGHCADFSIQKLIHFSSSEDKFGWNLHPLFILIGIDCNNFPFCGSASMCFIPGKAGSCLNSLSQLTLTGSDLGQQASIDHLWQFSTLGFWKSEWLNFIIIILSPQARFPKTGSMVCSKCSMSV